MKYRLLLIAICFVSNSFAQTGPYVKLKFKANKQQLQIISSKGVDLEHLSKKGDYYYLELSQEELKVVNTYTKNSEIVQSDLSAFYSERALINLKNINKNNSIAPPGFKLGSLGSYLNYAEMVEMLDSMRRRYPKLISVKKSIGNTLENNVQFVVKISDNPDKDEPQEKQVLYDAMHHAREPQGMMQLMYFMWYIMDRYEHNDAVAKYILENRELYFVPIVNPDGYKYNQTINPNGGGMWRKNRSNNMDATRGVDLNRNYGYDWAYDDFGSSPFGNSNTFRGPSAFSEPETQNMRNFVNTKKFKTNLSYHTYGGYLIYPFGAKENYYTPDSNMFRLYADSLTKDNGYFAGTVFETLSYFANGGSCDWMYGDTSHSKIFSFTPEVGFADDGFWPLPSRIIPLCEENIAPNLFLAKYAVNGLDVINNDTTFTNELGFSINLKYFSAGLENTKSIKSYLDFYNNPLLQTNQDTFVNNSFQTFTEVPFSFALNFNVGLNKYEIPYRVVTIINGQTQYDSAILIIDRAVGISSFNTKTKTLIYPNPSSTNIKIDYNFKANTSISIYNTEGKLLLNAKQPQIDISNLKSGIYFLSIKEGNKIIGIESFRKE